MKAKNVRKKFGNHDVASISFLCMIVLYRTLIHELTVSFKSYSIQSYILFFKLACLATVNFLSFITSKIIYNNFWQFEIIGNKTYDNFRCTLVSLIIAAIVRALNYGKGIKRTSIV